MEMTKAIEALGALAQETRLTVFRLLVRSGPQGMTAGEIAERLGVSPPTMSHHLGQLHRAGLVTSWRVRRSIFYAADFDGIGGLLRYLMEDCCRGAPAMQAAARVRPIAPRTTAEA
jgi:DNA-binding transcriptional ArsR family regulator